MSNFVVFGPDTEKNCLKLVSSKAVFTVWYSDLQTLAEMEDIMAQRAKCNKVKTSITNSDKGQSFLRFHGNISIKLSVWALFPMILESQYSNGM